MIMPPPSSRQLFQRAITAAAAASAVGFFLIDANPSLWLYDKLVVTEGRLRRELAGKRIWITGASSGIGAELAQQLAACDAELVISGRNEERLELVASQCAANSGATPPRIVPMEVDCSLAEMERVLDQVGPMDCVIFNAGIGQQSPASATSAEETERLFRINAMAPIHWTQLLLKKNKPPSQLVVTSSVASKFAVPLSASYAASKSAVHAYFTTLAAEQPNLKVCLPCPGPVATPLFDNTDTDADASTKKKKKKEQKMPAKRCARLMISTMIKGKDSGSHETWIAQQPTLFFLYLHQHLPGLANWLLQSVLGPTRVALWEAGLNIYDPASLGKLRKLRKEEAAAAASKED